MSHDRGCPCGKEFQSEYRECKDPHCLRNPETVAKREAAEKLAQRRKEGTAQSFLEPMGRRGLIKFLREQITEAEWKIARHKAEIAAYEQAIAAFEKSAEQIPE